MLQGLRDCEAPLAMFFFSEATFAWKQNIQYFGYYQIEDNLCGETRQLCLVIKPLHA